MAKKIDLSVIDQFFSAQVSANESEATLKALRPQVEEAVQALIEERGLPKNYTGTLEYHGFLKRTAEKLAKAHPDSESIKHGFTIAITA